MLDRLRRVTGRLPRSQWSPFAAPDACSGQAFYPVRFLSLSAYICVHPRFVCLFLFASLRGLPAPRGCHNTASSQIQELPPIQRHNVYPVCKRKTGNSRSKFLFQTKLLQMEATAEHPEPHSTERARRPQRGRAATTFGSWAGEHRRGERPSGRSSLMICENKSSP